MRKWDGGRRIEEGGGLLEDEVLLTVEKKDLVGRGSVVADMLAWKSEIPPLWRGESKKHRR